MNIEQAHEKQSAEKQFKCNECTYASSNKGYLRDHSRRLHSAKEGLFVCFKGKCEFKAKSFVNNGLLTKHQNTHNDLPCEKCPKHFGAKRNMKKHMANVHRDDKEVSTKNTKSVNIAHLGLTNVDVGDLLAMPLQALPSVDPLPVDPFLVDPLPIDDFYNDSFPIDLLPADLDQAFMLPNND